MKNVAIKGISGGEFCLTLQYERGVKSLYSQN